MLDATRDRIRRAAADLLAEGGRDAVSTRAVSAAAKVQPAAIYRAFGDMRGLLDVVAEETFARYLEQKRQALPDGGDPVGALRSGWDLHVRFGIEHPAVYALIFGYREDRPERQSAAAATALAVLRRLVVRVAEAGRLVVPVEQALAVISAAGMGAVFSALSLPQAERDNFDSSVLRDAVLDRILGVAAGPAAGDPRANAVALSAALAAPDRDVPGGLTPGERLLLRELLDRIAAR